MKIKNLIISLLLVSLMSCASKDIIQNNRYIGHYKVGKPYKINNFHHHPKEVTVFEQTGFASWYGDAFHGNKTANGEIFDKNSFTAAHTTLPLPSMVKVKNLENNSEIIVRINDRGPFINNKGRSKRIIDLSEKAAEVLGIKNQGLAKVKITLLPSATKLLHKKLNINQKDQKTFLATRKSLQTKIL